MSTRIPHLKATPNSKQLIVDGEPFLMLAGELQNSSMTSAKFMREQWPKLTAANINTVLGCVTWEMIEPEENKFDFTEFDEIVKDARAHGLRLVLLWFGSFKNGISTYAPAWVKQDTRRFSRAKLRKTDGKLEIGDVVSIFHTEAQRADAKAFSRLMSHIKDIDGEHNTIVMVQVENETGLLGDSRDRSRTAEERYRAPVPSELLQWLHSDFDKLRPELQAKVPKSKDASGSWPEVFGDNAQTEEIFMAYHYALYLNQVAESGKDAFPLPLYTNVWQNYAGEDADPNNNGIVGGGGHPGEYPSGGGVIDVLDVWQKFAPALDFVAPDVYLNDYTSSCQKYRHRNQPLFIPEQRRDEYGARRIWAAYGSYGCLGTSPFGIDTLEPETNPFKRHYSLLKQTMPLVLEAQRNNSSVGFFFDDLAEDGTDSSPPVTTKFGPWKLRIERCFVFGKPSDGSGMVIHRGGDVFLLIGWGFQVIFDHESAPFTGILSFDEKEVQADGSLKTLRKLNGDETRSGKFCMMPCEDPDYGGFPICVTIPSRTMIAEAVPYALEDHE